MALREVFLTKSVLNKMKLFASSGDEKDSHVLLIFGWITEAIGHCVGCAILTSEFEEISSMFPAGFSVLGVCCKHGENENVDTAKGLFQKLDNIGIQDVVDRRYMILVTMSRSQTSKTECQIYENVAGTLKNIPLKIPMLESYSYPSSILTGRVTGRVAASFEVAKIKVQTLENLERAFEKARDSLFAPTCFYHFENTSVLLSSDTDIQKSHEFLTEESTCKDLSRCYFDEGEEDGDAPKEESKKKKKHGKTKKEMFNVKVLFCVTGEEAESRTLPTAPVIYYEKGDFKCASFYCNIDVTAAIPSLVRLRDLPSLFARKIAAQLFVTKKLVKQYLTIHGTPYTVSAHHFKTVYTDHIITVVYPDDIADAKLENMRKEIHSRLLLPVDRPLIRKAMKVILSGDSSCGPYLQNVHVGLHQSGVSGGDLAIVQGTYTYHHYMQDRYDDKGWGCAYRSLQTLVSWFRHQGYTDRSVPSHEDIQKALVAMGDKPQSFVNSKKWIGSSEVGFCLDHFLEVQCKILSVSSGSELAEKGAELLYHFRVHGTPVMIGGGVLAHTILGVHYNNTGEIKLLVLDPHYTGIEDLKIIQGKGWCGWKGPNFWDKNAFYNLCLPQRPAGI